MSHARFPWKLAAVAIAVAVIAIFLGTHVSARAEPRSRANPAPQESTSAAPSTSTAAPPAGPDPADSPIPAGRGRIVVVNADPPGIRGAARPQGRSARRRCELDVHARSPHADVRDLRRRSHPQRAHRLRARPRRSTSPCSPGWVAVLAPIVLSVAADGRRALATTEESRLMLPPGKHQLTLTNQRARVHGRRRRSRSSRARSRLSTSSLACDREPQRRSVGRGLARWSETRRYAARRLRQVPLGLREFVFKNSQFGERKVDASRSRPPTTLRSAVDFAK